MILTRADTNATIVLPDDYYWEDEHATAVEQSVSTGLTGAALIQEGKRQYREATFGPWETSASWITRSTLDSLRAWADVPGLRMTLQRLGQTHTAYWRYDGGAALSADPVMFWVNDTGDASAEPQYRVTFKLWLVG